MHPIKTRALISRRWRFFEFTDKGWILIMVAPVQAMRQAWARHRTDHCTPSENNQLQDRQTLRSLQREEDAQLRRSEVSRNLQSSNSNLKLREEPMVWSARISRPGLVRRIQDGPAKWPFPESSVPSTKAQDWESKIHQVQDSLKRRT